MPSSPLKSQTTTPNIFFGLYLKMVFKVRVSAIWVTQFWGEGCLSFVCSVLCAVLCAVLCLVAQSCPTLCDPMDCSLPGSSVHLDSLGRNTVVGCHALLQGIFPTQGSNPGLPHCRQILYQMSHQGSPIILEWVAYPFSRGSSCPRN